MRKKDKQGEWQINRIHYELCVLEAPRDKLRCRELWVVGADKYRNYVEYSRHSQKTLQ